MQGLTPEGRRLIDDAAARHGFSSEAALALFRAMALGNGSQAQFNHPELGGMGQWSLGGMIMIGDMFNHDLKRRVAGLCEDLSSLTHAESVFERRQLAASAGPWPGQHYTVSGASVSLFAQGFGGGWWPQGLGSPSSSGSQNDLQYAFFPGARRLAINSGGRIRIFDTGEHQISGVSQQQGGGQNLTFSSQFGPVDTLSLPLVEDSAPDFHAPASAHASAAQYFATVDPQMNARAPQPASDDVLSMLERLAELRQKNIISDSEFAAKKSELLARI